MTIFQTTPEDILALDDKLLRELVAKLAIAEIQRSGHSALNVTWGGAQTTADGGLDVRVELLASMGNLSAGVPRANTGYQVKKPDMPRGEIFKEMRPSGNLRPVIAELAATGGAYIIVSSTGTTADKGLRDRRKAIRDALHDCPDATRLYTDFFDRTRLADWVSEHPGVILWLREKIGRALEGWRPYGPWSHAGDDLKVPYLIDDRVRVRIAGRSDSGISTGIAIDQLRKILVNPRSAVRLVGLSGVGKTRFVQALFDQTTGAGPLPEAYAVYADINHNPSPQPVSFATSLIAMRRRAILVVDNCGAQLHRELALVCAQAESLLSLITVEYDVREDLAENTEVVMIDTASSSLIGQLVSRRYPALFRINVETIAAAAEGNARIALAIAGTVGVTEDLARLTQIELFDRLFWQRHQQDPELLRAAQVCSLVYSFHGERFEGEGSELPSLATLAGLSAETLYGHVRNLMRRDLIQSRADWRAVLPHALANHLAGQALENVPQHRIQAQIVNAGNRRLLLSFSRRLSYLHTNSSAVRLCASWLEPGGLLSDVAELDGTGIQMLTYIAPVASEQTLSALERVSIRHSDLAIVTWRRHAGLLRSLAYEPALFARCVRLLINIVENETINSPAREVREILYSFFQLAYSGTHAPVTIRMAMIEEWLGSGALEVKALGRAALERALQTQLSSNYSFSFGAWPRDTGHHPSSNEEVCDWYRATLTILERLVVAGGSDANFAKLTLAKAFERLWDFAALRDELAEKMRRFAAGIYWHEGWQASQAAMRIHANDGALQLLDTTLAPADLASEVLSVLVPSINSTPGMLPKERYDQYRRRVEQASEQLGKRVASHLDVLAKLAPKLFLHGERVELFGRGLGREVKEIDKAWSLIVAALAAIPVAMQFPALLRGFLSEVSKRDMALAQRYLDEGLEGGPTAPSMPALQEAVGWDRAGIARLSTALERGIVPITEYRYLSGAGFAPIELQDLAAKLLMDVLQKTGGFQVVLDVMSTWPGVMSNGDAKDTNSILPLCRAILRHPDLELVDENADYVLRCVADLGLAGSEGEALAQGMAQAIRAAAGAPRNLARSMPETLKAMFDHQPSATLDGLYGTCEDDQAAALRLLRQISDHAVHPAAGVNLAKLVDWCKGDWQARTSFVFAFLPIAVPSGTAGRSVLSEQAMTLLEHSENPKATLELIIEGLAPKFWSGSRAEIMAVNVTALDDILGKFDAEFHSFASQAKNRLLAIIQDERRVEMEHDRFRDERFE